MKEINKKFKDWILIIIAFAVTSLFTLLLHNTGFLKEGYSLNSNSYLKLEEFNNDLRNINNIISDKKFSNEREVEKEIRKIVPEERYLKLSSIIYSKLEIEQDEDIFEFKEFYLPDEKILIEFKNKEYLKKRELELELEEKLKLERLPEIFDYIIIRVYNPKTYEYLYVINESSFEKLRYFNTYLTPLNKSFLNKKFKTKQEILSKLRNELPKDFYIEYEYLFLMNIEYVFNNNPQVILRKLELFNIDYLLKFKNKLYIDLNLFKTEINLDEKYFYFISQYIMETETDIDKKIFVITKSLGTLLILLGVIFIFTSSIKEKKEEIKERKEIKEEKEEIKEKEDKNPDKIRPVWEFAATEMKEQMSILRNQATNIYKVSRNIIIIGFIGIVISFFYTLSGINSNAALLSVIASILIEFIGATLMVIYKTTILQLNENLKILEKLNFVGMGIKILDTMNQDQQAEKLNETKCEIAKNLIDKIN